MGLYPDLLPGYHSIADSGKFHEEWGGVPQTTGLTLPGNGRESVLRKIENSLRGGRESSRAFRYRSVCFLAEFRLCAGHVLTETVFG